MKPVHLFRQYLLVCLCVALPLCEAGIFSRLLYNMMRNRRRDFVPYPLPLLTLAGLDGLTGLGGFGGLTGLGGLGLPGALPLQYGAMPNLASGYGYGLRPGYPPAASPMTNSVDENIPYMSSPIPAITAYPARALLGGLTPYDAYSALAPLYGLGAYAGYPSPAAAYSRPEAGKFSQFYDYNGDMKALKSESKVSTKYSPSGVARSEQTKPKTKYSPLESVRNYESS